jgi:ankyrin repeat protein
MARLLIGNNAYVSAINRKWQTPQHLASMNGHEAAARLFDENGAIMSL